VALAVLPDSRLVSGGHDRTIRLWDPALRAETARLEVDGVVTRLAALPDCRLVAGDALGRLHWLVIVKSAVSERPGPVRRIRVARRVSGDR
jgi:WD40 repeat protein